jgi:hypothetical protein
MLSFAFLLILISFTQAQERSPKDVVLLWTEVYGIDFDRASDLTTLNFREGKTKKDWAAQASKILKAAKYRHLGGKVIAEKIEGIQALIILDASIDTIAGGAKQKELYELQSVDGHWLINDIIVKEEEVEEKDPYEKRI